MKNERTSILDSCLKCNSKCCKSGSPLVLERERGLIVKITGQDFFKKEDEYYIIPKSPCPYLKDNKCSIQDIKPIDCSSYPLTIIDVSGNLYIGIYDDCIGKSKINFEFLTDVKNFFEEYTYDEKLMLAKLNSKQKYKHKIFSNLIKINK